MNTTVIEPSTPVSSPADLSTLRAPAVPPADRGGELSVAKAVKRNVAVDAYRGLVMLLMMGEVMNFAFVHRAYPGSLFWSVLAYNQTHVEWAGMSLHDMIQPSFTFLVGVALPYSIASRLQKGQTFGPLFAHTLWRSFLLVALGIFLRSIDSTRTNFTFEDTLTMIGLGYPFAFLLTFCRPRWQWTAFAAILFGYWLAWALYPVPGQDSTMRRWAFPPIGITTLPASLRTGIKTATWGRPSMSGFLTCFRAKSHFFITLADISH